MLTKMRQRWDAWIRGGAGEMLGSTGLLVLRLGVGAMMAFGHGWGKLATFADKMDSFPDPLGVGSSTSLAMAVAAEFFCSLALMAGFLTRLAAVPLIVTMTVAAVVIHGGDPWGKKELAVLYLLSYTVLLLCGPGRFSVDSMLLRGAARTAPQG